MELADRLKKLPPYIFAEIDRKKKAAIEAGKSIINIGIGDPDRPTPAKILEFIKEAADKKENHPYPIGNGSGLFKEAVVKWMQKRFGVSVSKSEVMALIGAKDGITHLPLAFVNPGDIVLIPDPGYPGYTSGTVLSGGTPYFMPLKEETGFLPDLEAIPEDVYKKTKIMHLNYPNNPTSAMAGLDFYEKAVAKAKKYGFIISQDAPYSEIYFDDSQKPVSILQIPGAKEHVIEFYSMSKTYNMTGWRVGFAAGGEKIIAGLALVKENMDSGTVSALQEASARALLECEKEEEEIRQLYKKRAEIFTKGLRKLGYEVIESKGTLYLWIKIPGKYTSMEFASKLLEEAGLVLTPGIGFGPSADKYVRIALTVEEPVIHQALERLEKLKF
jgi:LL-diaminopimelate aminotransferase